MAGLLETQLGARRGKAEEFTVHEEPVIGAARSVTVPAGPLRLSAANPTPFDPILHCVKTQHGAPTPSSALDTGDKSYRAAERYAARTMVTELKRSLVGCSVDG